MTANLSVHNLKVGLALAQMKADCIETVHSLEKKRLDRKQKLN